MEHQLVEFDFDEDDFDFSAYKFPMCCLPVVDTVPRVERKPVIVETVDDNSIEPSPMVAETPEEGVIEMFAADHR